MILAKPSKIQLIIAKSLLYEYFSKANDSENLRKRRNLMRFCKKHAGKNRGIAHAYLKLQRMEMNRRIVKMELQALPAEKQKFIQLHYHEQMTIDYIGDILHYGRSVFYSWNTEVLQDIQSLCAYFLNPGDIFQPLKTINLLSLINYRLNGLHALREQAYLDISPTFAEYLEQQRQKYRKLLNFMHSFEKCQNSTDCTYHVVVREKFHQPFDTNSNIAQTLNISEASVSRALERYCQQCKPYIN